MEKLFTFLFLLVIAINAINSKNLTIYPAKSSICLDGAGDDAAWEDISFINMEKNKGSLAYKNNAAIFKMTYDIKYIYIYAEVHDNQLDTSLNRELWLKDNLEVYFCMDTTSARNQMNGTNSFWQLRKVFGRSMVDFPKKGFDVEEYEFNVGERAIECRFPIDSLISTLKDKTKWDGHNLRFEIQNGDNDGMGRRSQLFWNDTTDDQYCSTVHMGYVYLAESAVPPAPVYTQKSLSIEKISENITIDGNSTENTWNNDLITNWVDATENIGLSANKNNSVRYKMAYDNDFVYVLVEVKDAALDINQSSTLTQKDGIELCFSMDTTSSSYYRAGDSKILKVYSLPFSDQVSKGYEVKEINITGGYQQEWKLSWESLAGKSNFSKKNFKFELINNDNDYFGRNSQLFWNSNIGDQESNNKHFGLVNINNKVSPSSPKTLQINRTNDTIIIDGKVTEKIWTMAAWNNLLLSIGNDADVNNTAKFKMLYDDENIYVLAEVKDALIDTAQSKNLCEKDGVELFFGMDTLNSNYPKKGDNYLRKVYGLNFVDQYSKGYEVKEAVISGGFRQEWKLPIMSLIGSGNYNDKNFRFDMKNNDNDGLGRVSQLNWSSKTSSWPGVANQGYVTFGSLLVYTSVSSNIQESLMSFNSNMIEFKQPSNYTIYNIVGKVVMLGNNANSVNISSLPKGIYVISANNENKKFIK